MNSLSNMSGGETANLILNLAVLRILRDKDIITNEEVADRIDRMELMLEETNPELPQRASAHEILEDILGIIRGQKGTPTPP